MDIYGQRDVASISSTAAVAKNFFIQRKCIRAQEEIGQGIVLNCSDSERVEVIGFLVNWMQTYSFIKRELRLWLTWDGISLPLASISHSMEPAPFTGD